MDQNLRQELDPFEFVKEQIEGIKLFVDLAATAENCKQLLWEITLYLLV